jgi:hypothetical protein
MSSTASIHLRGLYYRIISVEGGVLKPNGQRFGGGDWAWFVRAGRAARWLGYVEFERLTDERNEEPTYFIPEYHSDTSSGSIGVGFGSVPAVELPSRGLLMPYVSASAPMPLQPYRIVMIGEKSSLRNELLSVAQMADAELILPTGDISNTLIAGIVRRIIDDGRPAVILYFADFDPQGHNMPTAVARKVQALLTLWGYDSYDVPIQMHRVGLTRDQVRRLGLPSSPLKPGEKRRDKWIAAMGHEQTELDALMVLRPGELRRIADGPSLRFVIRP